VRKAKLAQGHNADYWTRKIGRNRERDREWSRELRAAGWLVLRIWESQIRGDVERVVRRLASVLRQR
jgi:DNA mismatch endonuclease (patch repair protein)